MITIILYYNNILYQYDINSDLDGFLTLVGAHTHVRSPTINVVYNNWVIIIIKLCYIVVGDLGGFSVVLS